MLKRIGFLLSLNLAFVTVSVLITNICGIPFMAAALLIIGVVLLGVLTLFFVYQVRLNSARVKTVRAMEAAKAAMSDSENDLSRLRQAAAKIADEDSRTVVLAQISMLEQASLGSSNAELNADTQACRSTGR
jgi:Sec-independent protein translocase protein TatA